MTGHRWVQRALALCPLHNAGTAQVAAGTSVEATVLAGLHLVGGTLALGWLLLPHQRPAHEAAVAACIATAYVIGVGLLAGRRRLTTLAVRVVTGFTITIVISGAVYFSGAAGSAFGLFYLWATLYAFYFFSLREALLQVLLVAIGYGVALTLGPHGAQWGEDAARWALTVATVLVTGGLVRVLTEGLRASEQRHRHVFERNPKPMWVYDAETLEFLAVNDAAVRSYGYSREEFLSMTIRDIRPAKEVPKLERAVASAEAAEELGDYWRHRKRDGTVIDVEILADELPFAGRPGRLVLATDVTERLRAERQLRQHAERDALTGVFNRRSFERQLEEAIVRAERSAGVCSVLVLDVDHLKYVNDSFGHAAGDAVLSKVAQSVESRIRSGDMIARIGGDEFAVLLPEAGAAEAISVAGDLLETLRGKVLHGLGRSTASIGIASFDHERPTSAQDLMVAADIATYQAKDAGRDRFVVSRGPKGGLSWIDEVREAIDGDRLVLYSQPILDLTTNTVTQEELLVRMIDRHGELLPPAAFIPTAERFGAIREIDRWVVQRAVELAREGRHLGVNLSAHSIGDRDVARIVAAGVEAGADGANLIFEITETAAAANFEQARDFAERLSRLGCGFALDDFGTGFGAFTYLKHIPVSYLKIDMEFVRDLPGSPADQRVVQAIVSIADGFGQRTVAEGVEDEQTLELLRAYGVRYAQGYHVGRPAPLTSRESRTFSYVLPPVVATGR